MSSRLVMGLVGTALILTCGCGKKDDESLAGKTGRKVGENLAEFTKGIDKGLKNAEQVQVMLADDIKNLGLEKTIAKPLSEDNSEHGFSIYMISHKKVYAMLCAKAYNREGQEIGRSNAKVDFNADDAQYVNFTFPEKMSLDAVARFRIEAVK
ncbi:MAG: hypothetical protein PHQ27_05935 [Victivallales bacterium]|nr:hypothetical protein [Victivallales bacterium]